MGFTEPLICRLGCECLQENVKDEAGLDDLVIPRAAIRRYENASDDTPFPLEFAFKLLGSLKGKTVVDFGCGEGVNSVILAALGAKVLAVDVAERNLTATEARARANGVEESITLVYSTGDRICVKDGQADRVFCAATLHHLEPITTARQIRRILKPGGIAVFLEPVIAAAWLARMKRLPNEEHISGGERPLSLDEVEAASRAVGRPGRRKEFLLTTRVLYRTGVQSRPILARSHRLDAWILRHLAFARAFASVAVWEARKEC